VRFVPGGKWLATASTDQTVCLWDLATGTEVRRLEASPDGTLYSLVVSPDGKLVASGDYSDGSIFLWDVSTGKRLHALELGGQLGQGIRCLGFSPDGAVLAAGETNVNFKPGAALKARVLLWVPRPVRNFVSFRQILTR
jgi:WD40 repeat protein